MAKGDDALAKKKNKAIRKRNRRAGANTTEAIEGVQSHKRRRKAGTRRVCESMCYSLPTPDDPFLDRKIHRKNHDSFQTNGSANWKVEERRSDTERKHEKSTENVMSRSTDVVKPEKVQANGSRKEDINKFTSAPLKKVVWDPNCDRKSSEPKAGISDALCTANNAFQLAVSALFEDRYSEGSSSKPRAAAATNFEQQWWQACAQGVDVLGTGCGTPCVKAYTVGAAPHVAVQKKVSGLAQGPFALILVKSKDQAQSVRQICKLLKKVLNIHTVSLHSEKSIELQVNGLAMQTPGIVVATPDRLCQLLTLSVFSLSSVSYVVVDSLDDLINEGYREQLDNIKQQLQKGVQVGVISKTFSADVVSAAGNWLQHPVARAVLDKNVPASSACILQSVSVTTTEESKLTKFNKILEQIRKNLEDNHILGSVLILIKGSEQFPVLKELLLKHKLTPHFINESAGVPRKQKRSIMVAKFDDKIEPSVLSKVEVAINYDFSWPIHHYTQILTGMARSSVKGRIETLCSGAAALHADSLVEILETCGQSVPRPLLLLAQAAALLRK